MFADYQIIIDQIMSTICRLFFIRLGKCGILELGKCDMATAIGYIEIGYIQRISSMKIIHAIQSAQFGSFSRLDLRNK